MSDPLSFRTEIQQELEKFMRRSQEPVGETALRIDLHCHDHNSDVPDETLARLLKMPETWLSTEGLIDTLRSNRVDVLTITNHNNARSCWELLDRGVDLLPGAEFSCTFPDLKIGVHVLTFGFTPAQEATLNRLRRDVYRFLEFTCAEDLPTVLAHPLHFYSPGGPPPPAALDRFAVLFERFEGVNGQRDAWQNLLTSTWVAGLGEEEIAAAAKRCGLRPEAFCRHPYAKRITGGSDCHMGLFAGMTGTLLSVPEGISPSARTAAALEALRAGPLAPYGTHFEFEKLSVAFLDLFCQAAGRLQDPGLMTVFTGRGSPLEKLESLAIANGFYWLRRHPAAVRFLALFHRGLHGKKPGWIARRFTPRAFRPALRQLEALAAARAESSQRLVAALPEALSNLSNLSNTWLAHSLIEKIDRWERAAGAEFATTETEKLPLNLWDLVEHHFRAPKKRAPGSPTGVKGGEPFFPLLASTAVAGVTLAAAKTLYAKREFLSGVAERLGKYRPPRRLLWLTDSLEDRNGVSYVLRSWLQAVRRKNLPIDFLTTGTARREDHLHVLPALAEFSPAIYRDQVFRLPGFLDVHNAFLAGGYDRVICSTEAPMGLYALYLKQAFSVPAYFYVHSDWQDFAHRALRFDENRQDWLRRGLSRLYGEFDGVFVLNSEQREIFSSPVMGIDPDKIFQTSHWADAAFYPRRVAAASVFPGARAGEPVLLYAGRLSPEKGVLELPAIFRAVQAHCPEVRLALAGTGPSEAELRRQLPEGIFLGWLSAERLAEAYSAATLLVLPSWFDTFSCTLLEAMSCGLPAVAYRTKGPRDLLAGERGGLLADGPVEMAELAASLLAAPARRALLVQKALERAADFQSDTIIAGCLQALGLSEPAPARQLNPLSLHAA